MDNTERFHEISDELYNAVKEYLAHHTQYATDVELAVNWSTREVKIARPSEFGADDTPYILSDFILINEQGLYEPKVF